MHPADDAAERAVRSFAAAMIAEAAHELNNRLATMRETVGLLEDLARGGKSTAAASSRAHASLDDQVGRALNTVRALGGIGGALKSLEQGFDAGAAIGDLLVLSERWARGCSLRVERDIGGGLPPAAGDPAVLLCLVNRLIGRCAAGQPTGGSLVVRVVRAGDRSEVRLIPGGVRAAAAPGDAADDDIDRELARRLGGDLLFEGGGAATIRLATAR
jgi:signal transduction histidine kinase